jgi:CRISPR-associated protein Cmr4
MYKKAKPFFMRVITPLHAGSGQDLGIVDMPIQRERHTGYPKIEGSGLKGSIRQVFQEMAEENKDNVKKLNSIYGSDDADQAAAIGFTDARLLLFPVKSVKGVFAYIICPRVLKQFSDDLSKVSNPSDDSFPSIPDVIDGNCLTTEDSKVKFNDNVILEEYTFMIKEGNCDKVVERIKSYTKIGDLSERLVILSDDDYKDFVTLSTEVITRTKIDPIKGTVKTGALFTEEYLPSESVMYSIVLASPTFRGKEYSEDEVLEYFYTIPEVIQIGGNATLGKGLVQIICHKGE